MHQNESKRILKPWAYIKLPLSDEQALQFAAENNTKILWDKIKSTFTGQTEDRKINAGLDVSPRELVYYTVRGLKGKFLQVRDILKTQHDMSIDEVLEIFREEETSFNSPSSTRAEGTSADVFYSRKYKNSGMRLCYICRRPNHVAKECFYRNQRESATSNQRRKVHHNNNSKERNTANPVFTASPNEESLCENIWILDSGVSCHMAKDRIRFFLFSLKKERSENSGTKPGPEKPGTGTKNWEGISLGDLLPSKFDHPHLPMLLQNVETDLETLRLLEQDTSSVQSPAARTRLDFFIGIGGDRKDRRDCIPFCEKGAVLLRDAFFVVSFYCHKADKQGNSPVFLKRK
ncbi:hypothetical protein AVEN_267611-1, partial [Araneus ventricosus]